jgi:DNA gyrase inhibitor GyrI
VPPHRMRGAAKHRFAAFFADRQASLIPMRIELRTTPHRLWIRRFVGSYRKVPTYWQAFAAELDALGLPQKGPFYGVIYDDPDIVADGAIRYGCAIEALAGTAPPPGFIGFEGEPSRFAIFSIHCTHLEGHARLRPRVLTWLQNSGETFGVGGVFEIYPTLPSGGDAAARRMELHISLAG